MKLKAFLMLMPLLFLGFALRATAMQQEPAPGSSSKPGDANGSSNRGGNRGGGADVSGPSVALAAMDEDYKIGPNDVIDIHVEDADELSGPRRVGANGTFLMSYLGRLPAKGKTTEALARLIENGLRGRYLGDPRVTVTVKNFNSRSFFVQGAVRAPGVYVIEGRPTLLELVTVAGGLMQGHGSTAFIIRKIKPPEIASENLAADITNAKTANEKTANEKNNDKPEAQSASAEGANPPDTPPQYTLLKANLYGLLKGRFEQNVFLEPGDVVNVPSSDVFFVAGEVKAPGSFPLKEGTTLRQAIALAQGENFKAAGNRTVIFREDPNSGKRQEIKVDLGAVLSGKAEDMAILANDIIIVPNSKLKSITAPMLNALGASAVRLPIPY